MLNFVKSRIFSGKTLFFIFIFILSTCLYSTIINVPADQPTIQAGIDAATNTDTVLVQPGTYVENVNYNGKLITVGSLFLTTQDTTYISSTIIDGNSNGSVVTFENSEDSTAVLSGFTISNGLGGGTSPDYYGGGITCRNLSSPSLKYVIISGNISNWHGGGIYCINYSSPILRDVTIISNSSTNVYGGGMYCLDDSSPILVNVIISGNSACSYGGGIYCGFSSNLSLENVKLSYNSAGYGGGIYCWGSSPILKNVTIIGNHVSYKGGGIYSGASCSPGLSLENVTISGNSAVENGGGIECYASYPILINSILWNNSPQEISIFTGSVTATYSDIQGGWTGTGNIDSDPLFVDAGNGDYHLQSTSPCIDAGDPASPLDPDGTIADMGTYYYNQYNGPTWHISTTGSDITGSGSEQYPFATIQHGINATANTDTVLVQPGTYVENIDYNGKLITVGSLFLTTLDTTFISSTVIDGNSSGSVVTFNNSEDSTAVLYGFTIINGSSSWGGGINCYSSSPILTNVTITGNSAYKGGGIYCQNSSPSLDNVTISNNSADWGGGGIYCYNYSSPNLQNVIITGNSATYDGGGISCSDNSSPSLDNVTISNNSASSYGGGIYCDDSSSPSLQNITISGNSATSNGGGIYCYCSSPSLENVIIIGNSAVENGGGGISCGNSSQNLMKVTISGNSARYGGGISCRGSSPNLENVTISNNSADSWGGGIFCSDNSSPGLENVTISGNSAGSYGGGIYCHYSTPVLINSILWNDSPEEIYISSGSVTATYSDIQGGFTGTGNIDSDPLFIDAGSGDYHLQSTSPCIDAGDPASPLDPDGTIADMGAYYFHHEYNGPIWHISTTGSDLTGNGSEQLPFATIQHGINATADTDTVLVQPGTYYENISYNGKLITVGSLFLTTMDTTYISSTYIDGNNNSSVIIFENGENSTTVLCGFTITNGFNYCGGGIYCSDSSPSLKNVTISGNTSDASGGGIYCSNSSPSLENVTLSNNDTNEGGGIYCYESSPSLEHVVITSNSADYDGGGIYCHNSSPSLENVTITGNSASMTYGYGGGICCVDYSSPIIENVTISGNSAYGGGGIYCYWNSSPSLKNVTISVNSAVDYGGGIYCNWNSAVNILNSILWSNSPEEIYISSSTVTVTYSDIQGGWAGTGNIDSDPLFVDLGNGDYHLQSSSPCIDAGDSASPLDPDGTIADMGAYYFHQTITPDPPQNVTVEIIGTDVHLSWDAVTGANSYKIYSSDDPYTGFVEDTSGSFVGESWIAPIINEKKFYYVIASTETIRAEVPDSQDAYRPGRTSRRYDSDKFINRKRK